MRRLLLAVAILSLIQPDSNALENRDAPASSAIKRRAASHPSATCIRNQDVGFFTTPEILGELGQVFANCYPHPACASPADLETIQFDGYGNSAGWLWVGPSNTKFNPTQQDALVTDAINRAGAVPGKVIVGIKFFREIITSVPVTYLIYFQVTFASCAPAQKGMTWIHPSSNAQTGTVTVGCSGCDPYQGDTLCTQSQPLLCIYKPAVPFPVPIGVNNSDLYYQWSGGVVATTPPVAGTTFADNAAADSYCVAQFGAGWRVAEFHDGWGWNFQAYGGTVSAPAVPSTRFWVYINDQPANCW